MEKCAACGRDTHRTAVVYIGTPIHTAEKDPAAYHYRPQTGYLCPECVNKHGLSDGKSSLIFYLALQMSWLSVFRNGLFSVWGFLAALIAVAALVRLSMLLAKLLLLRFRIPLPSWLSRRFDFETEASSLYQSLIREELEAQGMSVLNLREYRRIYSK